MLSFCSCQLPQRSTLLSSTRLFYIDDLYTASAAVPLFRRYCPQSYLSRACLKPDYHIGLSLP